MLCLIESITAKYYIFAVIFADRLGTLTNIYADSNRKVEYIHQIRTLYSEEK